MLGAARRIEKRNEIPVRMFAEKPLGLGESLGMGLNLLNIGKLGSGNSQKILSDRHNPFSHNI